MTKKIITIGGATQDIFISYANPEMLHLETLQKKESFLILKEGHKVEVEKINYTTGGGATNSAVSFKRLGCDVSIICKVGSDDQGEFIINNLQNESIDTNMIIKSSTTSTGSSFIVPSPSGDRSLLAYRGANTTLEKIDISLDAINKADQLYITSLSGKSSQLLLPIVKYAYEKNIPVATNPGSSQLAAGAETLCKALPYIETLILNSDEAKILMNSLIETNKHLQKENSISKKDDSKNKTLPQLLQSPIFYENISFNIPNFFIEILKRGPKTIVITNGAEGVYVAHKNSIYFHPSIKTSIANTLGAGDAFGSCFVASTTEGTALESAIFYGVINASSVISHLDAKTGLLKKNDLIEKSKSFHNSIQKYPL